MKSKIYILVLSLCLFSIQIFLCIPQTSANTEVLQTTFAWWNSQRWNIFDIDTKDQELKITWFSINSQATNWDIRVFYREWYYAWFEDSSVWWNLVWDYSFIWPWSSNPTFVEIDEIVLHPNSSYSFYIFVTSWTNLNYTNWNNEWEIYVEDNNLIIRQWVWKWADFNSTFRPRIWNGIIHYEIKEKIIIEWEITTAFVWWNWQAGNMFDIDILWTPLEINAISVNTQNANWTIRVYYREWYYAWFENSSVWWNLVWDYSYIGAWSNTPTFIDIDDISFNANTSYALYVTDISWWWIRYTNWTAEWSIFTENSHIQIREGIWKSFEFASTFRPRIWNWTLHYSFTSEPIDETPPSIEINNIIEENIYPNIHLNIEVNYNDNKSWINTSTISTELRKWNGTNWWPNILSTFLASSDSNSTDSNYNVDQLWLWKYKFYFYIEDNTWNWSFIERIFYVDEPRLEVSTWIIDIWNLTFDINNFSRDVHVKVQTVGSAFQLSIHNTWNLIYKDAEIIPWNGSRGFWYEAPALSQQIKLIQQNQIIWSETKNTNTQWEYNTYMYTLRFGAHIDASQESWKYEGNISFKIKLDYE